MLIPKPVKHQMIQIRVPSEKPTAIVVSEEVETLDEDTMLSDPLLDDRERLAIRDSEGELWRSRY